ncbi:hypothetical protein RI367_003707 [Sorochytrium milnesiophthora]
MSLTSTVALVALPWAIGKAVTYWRSRKVEKLPLPPRSVVDYMVLLALAATAMAFLYVWAATHNIFYELELPKNAPSWLMRARLRSYLNDQGFAPSSPVWDIDSTKKPRRLVASVYGDDDADLDKDAEVWMPRNEYDRLSFLYEKLRIADNRDVYALYSDAPLKYCDYCTTRSDYFYYALPGLLVPYAVMLVVVGTVTATLRKSHWRSTAIWAVLSLLAVEMLVHLDAMSLHTVFALFGGLFGWAAESSTVNPDFVYTAFLQLRTGLFVLLLGAISVSDITLHPTAVHQLQQLTQLLEQTKNVQFASMLMRSSALSDTELRRLTSDHYRSSEAPRQSLNVDRDLQTVKETTLAKLNAEVNLEQGARRQASDIVELAIRLSHISPAAATASTEEPSTSQQAVSPAEAADATAAQTAPVATQESKLRHRKVA